jgi:hypothetical protein
MLANTSVQIQSGSRRLICCITGESNVFIVTLDSNLAVSDLRKVIQDERALDVLKNVGPHILELWKVSAIDDLRCEVTSLFSAQGLQPYRRGASRRSASTYRAHGRSFGIC